VIDALRADPLAAMERFNALFRWPRASVRAWACYVGALVCGRDIVPALREMFTDRNQEVQEAVIDGIEEIDLDELRPVLPAMRKRLLTWDSDGAYRMARLLTMLNDKDAVPLLKRYAERGDIDAFERGWAQVYLIYLEEGLDGVLPRIQYHQDHLGMAGLCKLAFAVGVDEVRPALGQLALTAPDVRCGMIAAQTLDALDAARAEKPPPYWDRRLKYRDPPRP